MEKKISSKKFLSFFEPLPNGQLALKHGDKTFSSKEWEDLSAENKNTFLDMLDQRLKTKEVKIDNDTFRSAFIKKLSLLCTNELDIYRVLTFIIKEFIRGLSATEERIAELYGLKTAFIQANILVGNREGLSSNDMVEIIDAEITYWEKYKQLGEPTITSTNQSKKFIQPPPLPEPESEEYMTRKQVCDLLKFCLTTLYYRTKAGVLTSYRIGGKVLYKRSEVEAALQSSRKKNPPIIISSDD